MKQHFGLRQPAAAFTSQPAGRHLTWAEPVIKNNRKVPQQAASTKAAAGFRSSGACGRSPSPQRAGWNDESQTEAEGFRTQVQNSFDGHDFGNDADSACAKSYAFSADSDLQAVIDAWPKLPEAVRRKIVQAVRRELAGE